MATQSSILTWEIPGTEEPGRLSPQGHKSRIIMRTNNKKSAHKGVTSLAGIAYTQKNLSSDFSDTMLGDSAHKLFCRLEDDMRTLSWL